MFCFSLMLTFSLHAQSKFTVVAEGQPLIYAMKMLAAQCDYNFVYNNDIIDTSKKIDVDIASDRITEVLDAIFKPCGISYTIVGKQIALSVPVPSAEQGNTSSGTRKISGTVSDATGDALAAADIYLKGTNKGVFADMNGRYSIEVPDDEGTELVFSFIGMREQAVRIGKKSVIDVVLEEEAHTLERIVVTGYQTISRERSAGAFANVSGAEVRDQATVHGSLLRSLEGSATGLSITQTGDGVRYLIRGVSSINSKTEPLYIVDGVSMTKAQMDRMVNPNDVESINFLKDATAASIWGAQAANGVIVVTTRTGSAGKKLSISYNAGFTFKGKPDYKYQDMMTSREFIDAAISAFDPQTYKWTDINKSTYGLSRGDYRVVLPHEVPMYQYYNGEITLAQRDEILNDLASKDGRKEYEKYFMSNAFLHNQSLSFSGGNDKSTFYASLEYQRDKGSYRDYNDDYRFFFRDVLNVAKWLNLDLSISAYHSKSRSYTAPKLSDIPYLTYFDDDGNELSLSNYIMTDEYRTGIEEMTGISLEYKPVSDFRKNYTVNKSTGINANAGLRINFTDFLSYEGRFQYSVTNGNGENFIPADSYIVRVERAQATNTSGEAFLPSSGGHYYTSFNRQTSYTVRNQLNLDLDIGKANTHRIAALAGFEFSDRLDSGHNSFLRGYDYQTMQHILYDDYKLHTEGVKNPALPAFATATVNIFDQNGYTQTETDYRFVSMYANAAYTLMDKYSLNASIRVDQSNLFGSDPSVQFKPIWSAGAIWNMAKEDFLSSRSWVNRLNLRVSFGYAGNSPNPGEGGPYDILASTSDPSYSDFGLGYQIITPANDKLSWEKTRTVNVGADFAFLGNRLDGSIDLYDKRTTNLLAQIPVDPTTGFTRVLSNLGTMTNRGVELALSSVNIDRRMFRWTTDFNFTFNANKLVEMYIEQPQSPYILATQNYWAGYPYGTVFAYNWAGLDPKDGMPRAYDSKGEAVRSITAIDSTDAVKYMGTTVPPFYGSLSNDFQIGDFSIGIMFIYNLGHVMRNDVNDKFSYRFCENLHHDFSLRWKAPGDEAKTNVPAYYSLKNSEINETDITYLYRYADINVLPASYIKLREVSLGYSLPDHACKAIHAENISLRLIASNLFTIGFNGQGIDPESFYLSSGSRSDKYNPYISASLNIEF